MGRSESLYREPETRKRHGRKRPVGLQRTKLKFSSDPQDRDSARWGTTNRHVPEDTTAIDKKRKKHRYAK